MKKRKIYKRVTKGVRIIYKKRNIGKARCGDCGNELHGLPRMIKSRFKNLAKSKKRPERPYGGNLCSRCMRMKLIERIK